jgi:hypothetical protein
MQLQRTLSLLVVSLSVVGLGTAGCSQKAAHKVQSPQAEMKLKLKVYNAN